MSPTFAHGPKVCDVFVCSIWKAAGLFKAIDNDFSVLAADLPRLDPFCLCNDFLALAA